MRGAAAADDVLSLRVHSTSALIPNATMVSRCAASPRGPETGFPLNPSGTDTTPSRRRPLI